jgi:hypothetical protein
MFWTTAIYWTLVMRDSLLVHRGEPWLTNCSKIGGASTVASLFDGKPNFLFEAHFINQLQPMFFACP